MVLVYKYNNLTEEYDHKGDCDMGGYEITNHLFDFGNYTGSYFFKLSLEVEDDEYYYVFDEDADYLYYNILGLPEESPEEPEEPEEPVVDFNMEHRVMILIVILLVFSLMVFLFSRFGKKGMGKLGKNKIGKSRLNFRKISIYLIMFFAFAFKVFGETYNYARESMLLDLITLILIIGFVYYVYTKFFK